MGRQTSARPRGGVQGEGVGVCTPPALFAQRQEHFVGLTALGQNFVLRARYGQLTSRHACLDVRQEVRIAVGVEQQPLSVICVALDRRDYSEGTAVPVFAANEGHHPRTHVPDRVGSGVEHTVCALESEWNLDSKGDPTAESAPGTSAQTRVNMMKSESRFIKAGPVRRVFLSLVLTSRNYLAT